jgi:hypothetical protein
MNVLNFGPKYHNFAQFASLTSSVQNKPKLYFDFETSTRNDIKFLGRICYQQRIQQGVDNRERCRMEGNSQRDDTDIQLCKNEESKANILPLI